MLYFSRIYVTITEGISYEVDRAAKKYKLAQTFLAVPQCLMVLVIQRCREVGMPSGITTVHDQWMQRAQLRRLHLAATLKCRQFYVLPDSDSTFNDAGMQEQELSSLLSALRYVHKLLLTVLFYCLRAV